MLIGYGRVSTLDQDTAAQISSLKSVGCAIIFYEKVSGSRWERSELHRLLGQLRKGDVLVVWKLDRLSRYLGAGFKSLTENRWLYDKQGREEEETNTRKSS